MRVSPAGIASAEETVKTWNMQRFAVFRAIPWALLVFCCVAPARGQQVVSGSAAAPQTAKAKQPPLPVQLLQEVYSAAANSVPEERSSLLLNIANTVAPMDPSRSQDWALELLDYATKNVSDARYRAAQQKNALTALARVDPEKAAELFQTQDLPPKPIGREDVRVSATQVLFPRLWTKKGILALPQIQALAAWLGMTGAYPYLSMGEIVEDTAKVDREKAGQLISEAIEFRSKDPGFWSTSYQYIDFLRRISRIADAAQTKRGIAQALAAIDKQGDIDFGNNVMQVNSSKGSVKLEWKDYQVYKLLPLIEGLDPEWAAKVRTEYPQAGNGPRLNVSDSITESGVTFGNSSTPEQVSGALDDSRFFHSQILADKDPTSAADLAATIGDPGLKSAALAQVAANLPADDKNAGEWLSQGLSALDTLPPDRTKLRLIVGLSATLFARERKEEATSLAMDGLDLAEELISRNLRANPGSLTDAAPGYQESLSLVEMIARHDRNSSGLLERVRQTRNDALKAWWLVQVAKGMIAEKQPAA
jgi:hypothetical protein